MKLIIQRKKSIFLLIYAVLALIFVNGWFSIPEQYWINYANLLIAYIIAGGITFYYYASGKVKLFDPFTIISFLYMMIMIIYPIYDYSVLNLTKSGVDTSNGCIKATLIFVPSYLLFCFGYFNTVIKNKKSQFFRKIETLSNREMGAIGIICWGMAFVGCMVGQMSRGFSLKYILSMGSVEQEEVFITSSSGGLLFLLMLTPTLIVSQMMILIYSRSKLLKIATLILSLIYLFMRGSRMLLLVMITAPAVYWYVKRRKSPSTKTIILAIFIAITLFAILQIARASIARGQDFRTSVAEQLFSVDTYLSVLESDFSTYKVFYGIVEAIPEKMDYLFGKGLFGYTIALIVPRILWPGKPDAPERAVVYAAMGQQAVDSGNAYPNIGTFYSEFGVIGCLVFMWIFGKLASKARKLYILDMRSSLILYSCLWPFFFQLTARSLSNALYSLLFGAFPMIVAWLYKSILGK